MFNIGRMCVIVPPTRSEVSASRQAKILGLFGGSLMFCLLRYGVKIQSEPHYSFLFGDISGWPNYLKSFWPLDLAEVCLSMWGIMYLAIVRSTRSPRTTGIEYNILYVLGFLSAIGCFGSFMGATTFGWYAGIELFFAMIAAIVVLTGGLGLICLAIWCVGLLFYRGWKAVRNKPAAQPIVRFGHYMNADDVPPD